MTGYEGTDFDLVPASHPLEETADYALGIIDKVAGHRFGWYADFDGDPVVFRIDFRPGDVQ